MLGSQKQTPSDAAVTNDSSLATLRAALRQNESQTLDPSSCPPGDWVIVKRDEDEEMRRTFVHAVWEEKFSHRK